MNCEFKHPDGRWNIVEGTVAHGRVACLVCGTVYPALNRDPRRFHPNEYTVTECTSGQQAKKLSAAGAKKTCPENCLLAAKKHLAAFTDEMNRAANKTTNPEHKALIFHALDEFTQTAKTPDFSPLLANAVTQ